MYLKCKIFIINLFNFSRFPIFSVVFCLIFAGCSFVPNELRLAEQLMQTSPDSALHILQHIQSVQTMSDQDKALYGLLYFEALDNKNKPLQPDSLITFSLNYYQNHVEKNYLARCYYYEAKKSKLSQHFDDATLLYLKALDLLKVNGENYFLLGEIYSDIGDICMIQKDYNESLKKFQQSVACFDKTGNTIEKNYRIISIGKIYRFLKVYKKAELYYRKALSQTSDSLLQGFAFQEIGINYFWTKQYDSAQFYLRKSLKFPYKGSNYSIRCFYLGDLLYSIEQYDSAFSYAQLALKHPSNFFNQRDCYRILANTEYHWGDFDKMGFYISKYQDCADSVRIIERQTKAIVLEKLNNSTHETNDSRQRMLWAISALIVVLLASGFVSFRIYYRNMSRKLQLESYKKELADKQVFVNRNLSKKIVETRESQAEARRKATPEDRILLDKKLYEKCLNVSNWEAFSCEMNHAFNQIVDVLQANYTNITQKEIIWCCLQLLEVPNTDRLIVLDATPNSLYKLKQRLAQKMNLNSTKELDSFLNSLVNSQR